MFERRNIKYIYLKLSRKIKDFLLSDKSREFLIFLFFFFIAGGFWLLQTLNNDYEAEFSIPVRLKGVPNHVVLTSEPPSELRIKVKDKGTVLLNYMLGKSFFPVNIDFSESKVPDNHVKIYASELEKKIAGQLNVSTRLLSVKPDTLEYIYSTGKSKLVPVKLEGKVVAGRQYYISDTIYSPDSVLVCEIVVMPNEGTISLGYTFSYKVHRNGYAYEALSSLIEYLHKHYPQWDFICFTERENIPSMSLLKKLGYTNLGYLPSKNSQVFGKWLRQDTLEEITSVVR